MTNATLNGAPLKAQRRVKSITIEAELVQVVPQLASEVQRARAGIPGNAIEHVLALGPLCARVQEACVCGGGAVHEDHCYSYSIAVGHTYCSQWCQ